MNPLQQLYLQAMIAQQQSQNNSAKSIITFQEKQQTKLESVLKIDDEKHSKLQVTQHVFTIMFSTYKNNQSPAVKDDSNIQNQLACYLKSQSENKDIVITIQDQFPTQALPFFIKVIANLIANSLKILKIDNSDQKQNPFNTPINLELWKSICVLIRQEQIRITSVNQPQSILYIGGIPIETYLSNMVIFREEFSNKIFSSFNNLTLTLLQQVVSKSKEEIWTSMVFKMLNENGNKLQMTKQQFLQGFQQYTTLLNHYFKKQNLIMMTVENSVRNTNQLHNDHIFQEYLLIMGTFKASTQDFFKKICTTIFERNQNNVDLVQFGQKIQKIHQQMNCQLLHILPLICQLESQLLDHIIEQTNKQGEEQIKQVRNSSNYYLKQIEKLKNKCVYNGEDICNCKKCQWYVKSFFIFLIVLEEIEIRQKNRKKKREKPLKKQALLQISMKDQKRK